jgi:hypothetical protein
VRSGLEQEATRPAGSNFLQQQARFDAFVSEYNNERPHEALGMKVPWTATRPQPARRPPRVRLPPEIGGCFSSGPSEPFAAALVEGDATAITGLVAKLAELKRPIVSLHAAQPEHSPAYQSEWLLEEVSTSINSTAAGGNASLMMIG